MAKTERAADVQKLPMEEIQRRIAEAELQTKVLQLRKAERDNAELEALEERRHTQNRQRQAELKNILAAHEATVKRCRHTSGGRPTNILKGGGIGSFSIITRAIMPDGVTVLLQCSRCRMMKYSPSPKLKIDDPEAYLDELDEFNELLQSSEDSGLEPMRGPTFAFTNENGVPFIPERV